MNSKEIQGVMKAWQEVMEKKTLDPVNKKALDKDFDDREDKDIDNDGDTDSSDQYLHNRRKTIKKAMKKESVELDEESIPTGIKIHHRTPQGKNSHMIVFTAKDAQRAHRDFKKDGHTVTGHQLMYGTKAGPMHKVSEEVKLDELSNDTLGSYAKKNVKSALKGTMPANRSAQRTTGINRGLNKMSKKDMKDESVDLDAKSVDKALSHDCAKHVASEQWGFGECIPGQHTLVENQDGTATVTHYDVMFEHGLEFDVPVSELNVLVSESHMHTAKKKKMKEGLDESTSVSEFEEVVVDAYEQRSRGMRGALEQMWEAAAQAKHGVDGKYQETMKSKFKGKGANDMAKDANMDNPEVAADDAKGHEDATKAGRVVKGQAPARPGEKRMGDIKILRPVQGAVTKTTGKE